MDYFELAKNLVRMNDEWRQHGYTPASTIERLPKADLPVLFRPVRSQEPGIQRDAGVRLLLCRE
jgi:hypothetical protein